MILLDCWTLANWTTPIYQSRVYASDQTWHAMARELLRGGPIRSYMVFSISTKMPLHGPAN